jgi:2-hydroxyacyl-CoA lyase 1
MAELEGSALLARSLADQGVGHLFGVVGFPVTEVARAAQREGIAYIGFRNEQSASYAAGALGYLTGRPGVCLTVSGPGMVHAVAGLANAWANCWPLLLLGGAPDTYQDGQGSYQEAPQLEAARPFVKAARRVDRTERIPYYVEQAVRTACYGRPGAVYLDLPHDVLTGRADGERVARSPRCPEPPRSLAEPAAVQRALAALASAQRPLAIVGKGAAYARAEAPLRRFLEAARLPFLPTPMGKGVLPDAHPLCVAPARTQALARADLVLLIGARLNWILHFGLPPRFAAGLRVIQVELAAEQIGTNVPAEVALVSDAREVAEQLCAGLRATPWQFPERSPWWAELRERIAHNERTVQVLLDDDAVPMGYYRALREIRDQLPADAILVSEGASTMDIGRVVLPCAQPRQRLDAGSFGAMGVGPGFAIAAALVHPERKVVAVEGDSAFGFSALEVEVTCRHRLPITFIVLNNNGIGGGPSELDPQRIPVNAYTPGARYERVIEAFGGKGHFAQTPAELARSLKEALRDPMPNLINVMLDPRAQRKPQDFAWLTR